MQPATHQPASGAHRPPIRRGARARARSALSLASPLVVEGREHNLKGLQWREGVRVVHGESRIPSLAELQGYLIRI